MNLIKKILKLIPCVLLAIIGFYVIRILLYLISELLNAEPPTGCSFLCDLISALSSISCMECEVIAHKALWLWIIVSSLLILGIIIGILKCSWRQLFQRDKEQEDDDVRVIISGTAPLILYEETEITGSPTLTLCAEGKPSGGSYQWSILTGEDKIEIIGDLNNSSLQIMPISKSIDVGDVIIKVEYETSDRNATAQTSLTVHTPNSVMQVSSNLIAVNGPRNFGYELTVRYRVLDQFGERFPEGNLHLSEDMIVLSNPYNTPFEEEEAMTDTNAEYDDNYILLFEGQQIPPDYLAEVRQIVRANGVQIINHILIWSNTHIEFE